MDGSKYKKRMRIAKFINKLHIEKALGNMDLGLCGTHNFGESNYCHNCEEITPNIYKICRKVSKRYKNEE